MNIYLTKTPTFIQKLFPGFTWKMDTEEKVIYLTFDDGPVPEATPWVLEQLAAYKAKATFFCVGGNVQKNPELFQRILDAGHTVGNHTMQHLDGWATDNLPYYHDVRHAALLTNSQLFRPPFGRLKPRQVQFLQRHYQIVMWDVLSGDFDQKLHPDECLRNVTKNAGPGSIVVFHDSIKALPRLMSTLPRALEFFSDRGYSFAALRAEPIRMGVRKTEEAVLTRLRTA